MANDGSQVRRIGPNLVPTVEEAIRFYGNAGGKLTRECCTGTDPLHGNEEAIERRERKFKNENLTSDMIFDHLIAGNASPFENAVISFININYNIAQHL